MAAADPPKRQDAQPQSEARPDGDVAGSAEEPEPQQPLPHVDTSATGEPRVPPPEETSEDVYSVKLDVFEGPLDLLLQLIRKHELDILDIPISFITKKYLEYLNVMRSLHIDVTSEYLVMAATLTHIKSKMLLPPDPNADDGDEGLLDESDPRSDLVRRLLEYQKYKHAAASLGGRAVVGRDTFPRGSKEPTPEDPPGLAPIGVFRLFDAFERVLKRADQQADHQVLFERMSIAERVVELTELLHDNRRMRFDDLFTAEGGLRSASRLDLVLTFLALLEMCKLRVAQITQDGPLGELAVEFSAKRLEGDAEPPTTGDTDDTDTAAAEPPTTGDTDTAAAEPPTTSDADTAAAEPPTTGDADTAAAEPPTTGDTGDTDTAAAEPPTTSDADTAAAEPPPPEPLDQPTTAKATDVAAGSRSSGWRRAMTSHGVAQGRTRVARGKRRHGQRCNDADADAGSPRRGRRRIQARRSRTGSGRRSRRRR